MKQTKKHIAVLTSYFPSISETFVVHHITGLIDAGYDVTILARKKQDISKASQPEIIKKYGLLDKTIQYLPESPSSKLKKLINLASVVLENKKYWKSEFSLLKSSGVERTRIIKNIFQAETFKKLPVFDIYHAHFGINAEHLATMKQLGVLKVPYGVSFHGFDAHAVDKNAFALLKETYKKVFETASFVTVNTTYLREKVVSLGCQASLIHIIPVGIDVDYFKYMERTQKSKFSIISIGRLIPLKGHAYGIKVVHELLRRGFDINYTIVGSGSEKDNLQALITKFGIEDSIHLVQQKTQEEIKTLLYESDLFLMTSITDVDGRAEAQGLVTLEAQATGLPTVAFDSGGVADTLVDGKTGYLVKEKDIQAMADKVAPLIKEPALRKTMAMTASKFVKTRFDNQLLAQKMITLYKQLNESNL